MLILEAKQGQARLVLGLEIKFSKCHRFYWLCEFIWSWPVYILCERSWPGSAGCSLSAWTATPASLSLESTGSHSAPATKVVFISVCQGIAKTGFYGHDSLWVLMNTKIGTMTTLFLAFFCYQIKNKTPIKHTDASNSVFHNMIILTWAETISQLTDQSIDRKLILYLIS